MKPKQSGLTPEIQNLLGVFPDSIVLHRDDKILYVNPALLKLLDYSQPEELIGLSPLTIVHPDKRELSRKRVEDMYAHGGDHQIPRVETVLVAKDGRGVDVEADAFHIVLNGEPAMLGLIRDIRRRKAEQRQLLESESRFKGVYEGALDGMVIINNAGFILEVNHSVSELLGCGRETLLGKLLRDFYEVNFDLEGVRKTIWETGRFKGEVKLHRLNGELLDAELEVKGQITPGETLVVLRDMTEKKKLHQKLALNDKLATVGTLAAGVAHEVNNPLGYILGNLDLLKNQIEKMKPSRELTDDSPEVPEGFYMETRFCVLETIDGVERIRDIVRGLKTFSRINGDHQTKVNLNHLVDSAISMTYHEIKYKAKLERHLDPSLPELVANATRLQQVFVNMLINAAQAIPSGNAEENFIRVYTGMKDGRVFIRISDTGKGIPPEVLPRIFDPFFTTKPVGEGTGLGLSISREILQSYGGDIQAASEPGRGTTFTVTLPLDTGKALTVKEGNSDTQLLSGLRVLLVDDEAANVSLYTRMLRKNQHFVIATSSAREALEIISRGLSKIDVIVSDLNMPDMNGIEFYQAVQNRDGELARKIVFITGGVFSTEMEKFLHDVSNPRLDKPFEINDLLRAISHVAVP